MIITVWKPSFKNVNKVKIIQHYDIIPVDLLVSEKKKGCKVIYRCDRCNGLNSTTSHTLFGDNMSSITNQLCRSCRSHLSQDYIDWDKIKGSIRDAGYKVITTESEYLSGIHRSGFKLKLVCTNEHVYECNWNNWSRGKRCRKCYMDNRTKNSVKYKYGYDLYKFLVWKHTEKSYKNNIHIINPLGLKRIEFNIDHRFSIAQGFKLGILPNIIGSVINLEMLHHKINLSKGTKCSITLEYLLFYFLNPFIAPSSLPLS